MIRLLEETKSTAASCRCTAESFDIIRRLNEQDAAAGTTGPLYHVRAHAALAKEQAIERCIAAVEFTGQDLYRSPFLGKRYPPKVRAARDRGLGYAPKRARSTSPSLRIGTTSRTGTARSTSCPRRCGRRKAPRSCGAVCATGMSRPSGPITARSRVYASFHHTFRVHEQI